MMIINKPVGKLNYAVSSSANTIENQKLKFSWWKKRIPNRPFRPRTRSGFAHIPPNNLKFNQLSCIRLIAHASLLKIELWILHKVFLPLFFCLLMSTLPAQRRHFRRLMNGTYSRQDDVQPTERNSLSTKLTTSNVFVFIRSARFFWPHGDKNCSIRFCGLLRIASSSEEFLARSRPRHQQQSSPRFFTKLPRFCMLLRRWWCCWQISRNFTDIRRPGLRSLPTAVRGGFKFCEYCIFTTLQA